MEDKYAFVCENRKCKKEYKDDESEWLDDDENEEGEHLWLVYATCPYCGKVNYYEIWDDFSKASMLIKATRTVRTNSIQKAFNPNMSDEYEIDKYSKSDLQQIAEHLLAYCNNNADGD